MSWNARLPWCPGPLVDSSGGSFGHSNKVYIDFYQNDGPAKGPR